jgi:hypothetical protein
MAEINVSGNMKVGTLRKQFKEAFGSTLRVYFGNNFADDNATLASIRKDAAKKSGELVIKGQMQVGNFETRFEDSFGIKVQVATPDNSALAPNSLTLTGSGLEPAGKATGAPAAAKKEPAQVRPNADKPAKGAEKTTEEKAGSKEYIFLNEKYTMGRLVNAVVRSYVSANPGITYDKLKSAFPDGILRSYGVFTLKEKAIQMFKEKNKKFYYIEKEELIKLSDSTIATCTQWTKDEFPKFMDTAKALKINIQEA